MFSVALPSKSQISFSQCMLTSYRDIYSKLTALCKLSDSDGPIYIKLDHIDPYRALLTWQPPKMLPELAIGYEISFKFDNREMCHQNTSKKGYCIKIPKGVSYLTASVVAITKTSTSSDADTVKSRPSSTVFLDLRSKS